MKMHFLFRLSLLTSLFFILPASLQVANAQESFQVKWSMDYTLGGTSSHANFTPANATLLGGSNSYALESVYSPGGAIGTGYITRPWPTSFTSARAMEFAFSANSFKYSITSFTFRLRRSATGPDKIKVRSSADHFTTDIDAFLISNSNQFNTYVVPVSYSFLSNNTFSFRIYAYNAPSIHGVLWFDEIIINGLVHPIILPVSLTYFKAVPAENHVDLHWETASEHNSSRFVVEKSVDLIHFEAVDEVPAAGESEGRRYYQFKDDLPAAGANYYRLRLVDKDGSFAFSQTVDALFENNHNAFIQVTPNPADPEKIIISGIAEDPQGLVLTSSAGSRIAFEYQKTANNTLVLRPLTRISPGLYFLIYQKNIGKEHVKILVR
ncbi:T9SS type A sorting domain-containing protein [Dyadobacter crusticola]|uniref:T9SS type A sorting domain-containing protein n=1 Tax=Dyadobacter crusticola TaxID=292407 RepID=UPI0004E1F336|nr:T9SS type A sorting domain-containing protein [Dyadobacter crusticola]